LSRRRVVAAGLGIAAAAAIGFSVYWFEPHKLVIDSHAAEPPPASAAAVASGDFQSLEHETSGRAELVRLPEGRHVLRLADLKTSNGPKLRVYLSAIEAQSDGVVYDDGPFVDLGDLKANLGSSNYDVPAGVDVAKYRSAVVWCQRFSVGFGVAPLR